MKSVATKLAYVCIIVGLTIATTIALHYFTPISKNNDISYTDFLSVTLSALSIMITILGIFVAVLGIIGWTTFESKLRDNSLTYLAAELSKDGKLRKEFEEILTEMSLQGIQPPEVDNPMPDPKKQGIEAPYHD